MGKDHKQLRGISKLFTEATLVDILSKISGIKSVSVTGWKLDDASAKGDSYLSTVDRITVQGIISGKKTEIKIVVKSLPQNLGRRKTYRSTDFFFNEIKFYTKVLPEFKEFLVSKHQEELLLVPNCLAFVLDGENDFIVMNDVSVDGFGPASRQSTLSLEECKYILKGMANFHGISFAFKNQNETKFYQIIAELKETYFSEEYYDWMKTFHQVKIDIAKDAVAQEYPGTLEEKISSSFDSDKLLRKCIEICGRIKTPTSVVTQGDAWAPNFLMRKNPVSNENQVLLLDFQLARCAGVVSDISFFIYSCTDKKLRDNNFDDLLRFYHDELTQTISKLGSRPDEIYPWDKFQKEVKEEFIHGLAFAMESIPLSVMEEGFNLDVIKGHEAVDIADVWILKPIKESEKRRRLADVIVHAINHGYTKYY